MSLSTQPIQQRAIGVGGTAARIIVGVFLVTVALWGPGWWGDGVQWHEAVLGLVGFPAAMLALQFARLQYTTEQLQATNGLWFCLGTAAAIVLFSVDFTRDSAALFFGASMLLAVARGYAGCEITAISNWLLRRDDQVGCVVFSPIDEIEARIKGSAAGPAALV